MLNLLLVPLAWVLCRVVPKDRRLLVCGGRQFGGNTAPVFLAAARFGLRAVWLTTRPEILGREGVVNARSLRGVWLAARAGGVCLTHSLGDFSPARFGGGTRIYNLWHGMPIKRISTQDPDFWKRSHAKSNVREMKRYRAMFATSDAMAELFAKTFLRPRDSVYVTGQPRNDAIFADPPDIDARYDPPLPPHSRKILYCPTWREGQPVRLFPFPDRDLEAVQDWLAEHDAVLFVRTHPNDPGRLEARDRRLVPMQGDVLPEVTDGLALFDALITDYSSVYYDYLMLDRPTVFLPYDLAEYAASPGFYLPFEDIAAGPCPTTQAEFLAALAGPDAHAADRARVQALVYRDVDAGSTERVLRWIAADLDPARGEG